MIIKYGTYTMFQNVETEEVKEVALADEEEIKKYASDKNWRRVGDEEVSSDTTPDTSRTQNQE